MSNNSNSDQSAMTGILPTAPLNAENLLEVVANLMTAVNGLTTRMSDYDIIQGELRLKKKEVTDLKGKVAKQSQEIAELRRLLTAPTPVPTPIRPPTRNSPIVTTPAARPSILTSSLRRAPPTAPKPTSNDTSTATGTDQSNWATVTRQYLPPARAAPSVRKFAAATRAFAPSDPSAPTGFEYMYLSRKRKFTRTEIRSYLRRLGVDTSRVLDISFPSRSSVGLLIHALYVSEVKQLLKAAKVEPLKDFDPLDPNNLADPKYTDDTEADRMAKMFDIHSKRCSGTLNHVRPHLVPVLARMFFREGWIGEDALAKALDISSSPPVSKSKRSRVHLEDDPGHHFRNGPEQEDPYVDANEAMQS